MAIAETLHAIVGFDDLRMKKTSPTPAARQIAIVARTTAVCSNSEKKANTANPATANNVATADIHGENLRDKRSAELVDEENSTTFK